MRAYSFSIILLLILGCGKTIPSVTTQALTPILTQPMFEDITEKSGLNWTHNAGKSGHKYLPETVGGGGGFIDYDNDGFLDIILIANDCMPGYKGAMPHLVLYHNNGDGTFTDVTLSAGLNMQGYALGLAVGDYDNDGWPDVYVTGVGTAQLFHNEHGKGFKNVTQLSGAGVKGFTTAATWVDIDHDGRLDLFVGRYVDWTTQTDLPCGPQNARQYCPPNQYHGTEPVLLRNMGNGKFEDISKKAHVLGHSGKTLGIVPYDFNNDGWVDLYIANDTEPDVLLINNKNGTFTDRALTSGVAVGSDGSPTGSMGVDVGTPFRDGRAAIAIGTFAGQQLSLFVSKQGLDDSLLYENLNQESGLAEPTSQMTTFGLAFADVDLDGWLDLLVVNGHIDDDPSLHVRGKRIPFKQPIQLFQNTHNSKFNEIGATSGLNQSIVGRGLAIGDFDNDGKPDLITFENGGKVRLWHNRTITKNHWLGIKLIGIKSPRDGSGAMVTIEGNGWSQTRCAGTTRSYLSASDPRVLFGVGNDAVAKLTIRWSSGKVTEIPNPKVDRYLVVRE